MEDAAMNAFLRLMKDAFNYAKRAHACSFSDSDKNRVEDKCSALSYAAACTQNTPLRRQSTGQPQSWHTPKSLIYSWRSARSCVRFKRIMKRIIPASGLTFGSTT